MIHQSKLAFCMIFGSSFQPEVFRLPVTMFSIFGSSIRIDAAVKVPILPAKIRFD